MYTRMFDVHPNADSSSAVRFSYSSACIVIQNMH